MGQTKGDNPLRDSYSAFFDNDYFAHTGLDNYLKEKRIKTIYVCGLATDICVKYTALDGKNLGYKTYLLINLSKGFDHTAQAVQEMKNAGVFVTESSLLTS